MICLPIRDARPPNTAPEPIAAPFLRAIVAVVRTRHALYPNSRSDRGSSHVYQVASRGMDLDPDNPLAVEIRQEMAATYFAACRKMADSLEALKAFDRTVASATRDAEQVAQRSELLEDAAERVYFVIIQREAMKLLGPEEFFEDYEVPAEVRARLGPRRRK